MTETQKALRRRRVVLWGLAASLALNGFLIGVLAIDRFFGEQRRGGLIYFETRAIGRNLPDAEQEALRDSIREMLPQLRQDWRRLRELRREINELLAAPEPDREAIEARLAEIRQITSDMQQDVQVRIFDEVLSLPPETRARLAAEEAE